MMVAVKVRAAIECIRRVRVPALIILGIVFVALPLSDNASSIYLAATGFVLWWVPGMDTVVQNFRLGYREGDEDAG